MMDNKWRYDRDWNTVIRHEGPLTDTLKETIRSLRYREDDILCKLIVWHTRGALREIYCPCCGGIMRGKYTKSDNKEVILELIKQKKCSFETGNDIHPTALYCSISYKDFDIFRCLVDNGADINHKKESEFTPYTYSILLHFYEATAYLEKAGCDTTLYPVKFPYASYYYGWDINFGTELYHKWRQENGSI